MVKVYLESLKNHLKCELEYKISFIVNFLGGLLMFFSYYFIILALFTKFNNIKGFTLYEVLLCFSIISLGFSFNEVFFRGLDKFDEIIMGGELDRILVRPQNVLFQVLCSRFNFVKIARILEAIIVMVISLINLNITFSFGKIICLILMILASIIIFFCIFLLSASYCFITLHGLEIRNLIADGGKFAAQYPIGIYKKVFRLFFTFIIPYALVNYYPLLYFLGKSDNALYLLSPLLVIAYVIPSYLLFKVGLKHYGSIGS